MHLTPSDPDVNTLMRKILDGRLDLQPNFQRGEVWGIQKKQRLIDSILRGWHIPPVHVIQSPESDKQEVLDGQQRLAAIRDFMDNKFAINGEQDPLAIRIQELGGLRWNDLPTKIKSQIVDFTIRVLTISDFEAGEPGELFYRLNQPSNLTSAEQRNAYFGEARQQVKDLSEFMIELGFDKYRIGFSNSRMAYDDVIAKFLLTLELGTLQKKITANSVTARYRHPEGFSLILIDFVREALMKVMKCLNENEKKAKLNKATLYSWLLFLHKYHQIFGDQQFVVFFAEFENFKETISNSPLAINEVESESKIFWSEVFRAYQDRASSRVADTSSVILRDLALWTCYIFSRPRDSSSHRALVPLARILDDSYGIKLDADVLMNISRELAWGADI